MNAFAPLRRRAYGFTIVELVLVIVVLSILVSMTIFFIGDWRGRTAQTEVQNSLKNAAAAMENARDYGTGYPASIPSIYVPSQNVTVQLISSTTTSFCLKSWSTIRTDIVYYMTNQMSITTSACS